MKTITKEFTIYEYAELTKEAQQKALEHFRSLNWNENLSYELTEYMIDELEKNGITYSETPRLYYSLSHSQGDGVGIEGRVFYKDWTIELRNGNHSYYTTIYSINRDEEYTVEEEENIDAEVTGIVRTICKKIEKVGYEQIEYEDSEEYIAENIEMNECTFLEDGTLYNE